MDMIECDMPLDRPCQLFVDCPANDRIRVTKTQPTSQRQSLNYVTQRAKAED